MTKHSDLICHLQQLHSGPDRRTEVETLIYRGFSPVADPSATKAPTEADPFGLHFDRHDVLDKASSFRCLMRHTDTVRQLVRWCGLALTHVNTGSLNSALECKTLYLIGPCRYLGPLAAGVMISPRILHARIYQEVDGCNGENSTKP